MDPKDLAKKYNAVFGGFAIRDTTFRTNSWGLNVINSTYQDKQRGMKEVEAKLVRGAVRLWALKGRAKTYQTKEIMESAA